MGDATADNHRTLNNTASTIANFRQAVFRTSAAQALFVNASTSANKTSLVRLVNTSGSAGAMTATAYDESGAQLGTSGAILGSMSAYQTRTFSSAELQSLIGFTPASSTAKYAVYFSSDLPAFQVINYTRDVATGALTLSQPQYGDRSATSTGSVTRSAWFVSSSTSSNKTNVLRLLNTSTQDGTLSATLYDENGVLLGYAPSSANATYRLALTANMPSFEVINHTKLPSNGNLYLAQAQTDNREAGVATSTTRNAYIV